jgi:hypothetical protein
VASITTEATARRPINGSMKRIHLSYRTPASARPAFQTAALQANLQANGLHEPAAPFHVLQPPDEESPAQVAVSVESGGSRMTV